MSHYPSTPEAIRNYFALRHTSSPHPPAVGHTRSCSTSRSYNIHHRHCHPPYCVTLLRAAGNSLNLAVCLVGKRIPAFKHRATGIDSPSRLLLLSRRRYAALLTVTRSQAPTRSPARAAPTRPPKRGLRRPVVVTGDGRGLLSSAESEWSSRKEARVPDESTTARGKDMKATWQRRGSL